MGLTINDYPRLCSGIFFILFTRAMQRHGRTTGAVSGGRNKRIVDPKADASAISERNALKGLMRIYWPSMPDFSYSTEKSNPTKFKQCKQISMLQLDDEDFRKAFDTRIKTRYNDALRAMTDLVHRMIGQDDKVTERNGHESETEARRKRFVRSLLELIDQDPFIPADTPFYVGPGGQPITKADLRYETSFCLEAFALGVWHYCILNTPDNTIGQATYRSFYPDAEKPGAGSHPAFTSSIGTNPSRIIMLKPVEDYLSNQHEHEPAQSEQIVPDGYYNPYFHSVAKDISAVKTILSEETINFRDFYVCNGLRKVFQSFSDFETEEALRAIEDQPNIDNIRELGIRLIIQAADGMGKSMLTRHFMLDGIERYPTSGRIPVYIRLKDYARTNYDMIDFIYDTIRSYFPEIDRDRLNQDIAKGRIVLILDGLDEIKTGYKGQFETKLNRFLSVNDKTQVILSTRQFSRNTTTNNFKVYYLQPLTKEKALEIVDRTPFSQHDPSKKAAFRKALDEHLYQDRSVFATNPLLLTFMLMTFERYGGGETSMPNFYAEVYELLSTRHDNTKEGYERAYKSGLLPERLRDIFAAFCAITYEKEKIDFSHHEFVEIFQKIIQRLPEEERSLRAEDILEDLISAVCMLYREGDQYFFYHRSFQEYFCALSYSKQSEEKLPAIGRLFEKRNHLSGDVSFQMLCGIIPEKVERHILLPFLEDLVGTDEETGYRHFLCTAFQYFEYDYGDIEWYNVTESNSYLYTYIRNHYQINQDIGYYKMDIDVGIIVDEYAEIETDGKTEIVSAYSSGYRKMIDESTEDPESHEPIIVGYLLGLNTGEVYRDPEKYQDVIDLLNRDDFPLKIEYHNARRLMMEMKARTELNSEELIEYI